MNKILLTTVFTILCLTTFSQDNKDPILKKIKTFINRYSVTFGTSKTGKNPIIYYNRGDKILDIDGYQTPLLEVKATYYYFNETSNDCVSFDCRSNDCVINPGGQKCSDFFVPFLNKKYCYDFIELINQLKK
jgi:hypothetical protein